MVIKSAQKGFTIVELLIVIVIIGILAAIVIVAYNGITNSAKEAAAENDLANIAKKLEIYRIEQGRFPTSTTEMANADVKVTRSLYSVDRNNVYYCRNNDNQTYAIGVEVTTGTQYYLVNGTITPTTGVSHAGTCDQADPPNGDNATGISAGYDWPGDGTGNGWHVWTE